MQGRFFHPSGPGRSGGGGAAAWEMPGCLEHGWYAGDKKEQKEEWGCGVLAGT